MTETTMIDTITKAGNMTGIEKSTGKEATVTKIATRKTIGTRDRERSITAAITGTETNRDGTPIMINTGEIRETGGRDLSY